MAKNQKSNEEFFKDLKDKLKQNDFVVAMFKVFDTPIDFLDEIEMDFEEDLGVSAKTKGNKIFFNHKLLEEDPDFSDNFHYAVHEIVHSLQIKTDSIDKSENENDYLENQNELDAFQVQILYKLLTEGKDEVRRYIKQVVDHHEVEEEEKEDKAKDLAGEAVYEVI